MMQQHVVAALFPNHNRFGDGFVIAFN